MVAFRHISSRLAINILRSPNTRFRLPSQVVASRGLVSKLFIGGLSFYTTEDSLSESFSKCGQAIEAKIVMDRVSDRSKGFGFVTFASQEEADEAVSEMNGKILNGRTVFVDYAKAKPPRDEALPIARPLPQPLGKK